MCDMWQHAVFMYVHACCVHVCICMCDTSHFPSSLQNSLRQIQKAIKGLVVMSEELEKVYTSFINNQVCHYSHCTTCKMTYCVHVCTRVAYGYSRSQGCGPMQPIHLSSLSVHG